MSALPVPFDAARAELATTLARDAAAVPPAIDLVPGRRIAGYVIEAVLGQGGFGTVVRARHEVIDRVVALKVLHADLAAHPGLLRRFELEARAVNRIRHPSVPEVYDLGALPDGRPYLLMELLEGEDLHRRLADAGKLSLSDALAIVAPVAEALAAAHAQGIVHRDVKASNVFLCRDGRVALLDFGIAKLLGEPGDGTTVSRAAVGTPACMAPEQLRGDPVDGRTDVYALAVLTYQTLSGELPFQGDSLTVLEALVAHARRPRISSRVPVPAGVDAVLERALAAEPDRRTPTVGALIAELRAAAGQAPEARAVPTLAAYLDVQAPADALDDGDPALLGDLDTVLPLAGARLAAAGWVPVLETGSAALWVRACAGPHDHADGEVVLGALWEELASRPARDPRVSVALAVTGGPVRWVGASPRGGEILRVAAWASDLPPGSLTWLPGRR